MSILSIKAFLKELEDTKNFGGTAKETSVRGAFATLLKEYAGSKNLILVPEVTIYGPKGNTIRPDGVIKDRFRQDWGYWESKDSADDLDKEISKKLSKGYPDFNILFEDSSQAILIQDGKEKSRVPFTDHAALDNLLKAFISYERPEISEFRKALELFAQDVPKVTIRLKQIINEQEASNPVYQQAREVFVDLCKAAINPAISVDDVKEMMVQHILTADIFNTVFDEPHFHRENNIARELEKVLDTFFTGSLRREALNSIQHYYQAIKAAAARIQDHHEKQKFLKELYEAFYKSYNPRAADRLGVVYTPTEIVRFMVKSTDHLLFEHFGKFLESEGVDILDPATGTGTFICEIIEYIPKEQLDFKYNEELHANEIAILPYYIANLNIEFTFRQKMKKYAEFKNICFVDTIDNMSFDYKEKQTEIFGISPVNVKRIQSQNTKKISVIIGNPPYNAKQENYNFLNSNRAYFTIDDRIKNSFIRLGTAQNQIGVYDMYTRFYRWAFDRLNENGIIAFVTNRNFIDGRAFDGFRKVVQENFDYAYIIDTKSDVRANPKISGTANNVFGIQTGVAIMFLVKKTPTENRRCQIKYISMEDHWPREEKLDWFNENISINKIPFKLLIPDKKNNWINHTDNDFNELIPLISKETKAGKEGNALFKLFTRGVATQRDEWVYDFSKANLERKMQYFAKSYAQTLENESNPDKYKIKWDEDMDNYRQRGIVNAFNHANILSSLYRPFVKRQLYFDKYFNGRTYQWFNVMPVQNQRLISFNSFGMEKPFAVISSNGIVDVQLMPNGQTIPFLVKSENKSVSNITPWAIQQFQNQYPDVEITDLGIFHYVYAVIHNPAYRKKYEVNLKRDFPRIPFYPNFNQWTAWGSELMNLHINYENVQPFGLKRLDSDFEGLPTAKLKADYKTGSIFIDEITTLNGIPDEAWEYKLGNRSALEWIIDQYKERSPKDPTVRELFNTYRFADYKEQVIDLLDRVCRVSVRTVQIQKEMESQLL